MKTETVYRLKSGMNFVGDWWKEIFDQIKIAEPYEQLYRKIEYREENTWGGFATKYIPTFDEVKETHSVKWEKYEQTSVIPRNKVFVGITYDKDLKRWRRNNFDEQPEMFAILPAPNQPRTVEDEANEVWENRTKDSSLRESELIERGCYFKEGFKAAKEGAGK